MSKILPTPVKAVGPKSDLIQKTCLTRTCTGMRHASLVKNAMQRWWKSPLQQKTPSYFVPRVTMLSLPADVMLVAILLDPG